jgi:hypothetical protein
MTICTRPMLFAATVGALSLTSTAWAQENRAPDDEPCRALLERWHGAGAVAEYDISASLQSNASIASPTEGTAGWEQTVETSGDRHEVTIRTLLCDDGMLLLSAEASEGQTAKYDPPLPLMRFPMVEGQSWIWQGTVTFEGTDLGTQTYSASGYGTVRGTRDGATPTGAVPCVEVIDETTISDDSSSYTVRSERCVRVDPWPLVVEQRLQQLALEPAPAEVWTLRSIRE